MTSIPEKGRKSLATLENVKTINFFSYVETVVPVSRGNEVSEEANQ